MHGTITASSTLVDGTCQHLVPHTSETRLSECYIFYLRACIVSYLVVRCLGYDLYGRATHECACVRSLLRPQCVDTFATNGCRMYILVPCETV